MFSATCRLQICFAICSLFTTGSISTVAIANTIQKEAAMHYEITVETLAAQTAIVIKDKVEIENAGEVIGQILSEVEAYLTRQQIAPTGAPFTRTFSFENGILEFEAGFPVPENTRGSGRIMKTELPQGKAATTIHIGSQESSPQAYEAIHAWIAKNGKKAAGAPWESYLTDPATTPPEKSRMQIFFPIK